MIEEMLMVTDEDYIRKLAYGMRLVPVTGNKHSIRDEILFPHMRPQRSNSDEQN